MWRFRFWRVFLKVIGLVYESFSMNYILQIRVSYNRLLMMFTVDFFPGYPVCHPVVPSESTLYVCC